MQQEKTRPGALEHELSDLAPHELLQGVVSAARALLEATDFKDGLTLWLARLAESVHANRATYGSLGTHADSADGAHVRIGWSRAGYAPDSGTVIHETDDCVTWFDRLRAGDTVHAQLDDLRDPGTNRIWNDRDCQSILLLPVVVDGRSIGWLGFEWRTSRKWPQVYQNVLRAAADGAEIAIKRLEAENRASAEREARLEAERKRAEAAEADAQSVRVREELIRGVTEAAKFLLGPDEFDASVSAALAALGAALAPTPERVALVEDIPTPDDRDPGHWRITHEWYRVPPQPGNELESGEYPSRDWWNRIRRDDAVVLQADFTKSPGIHKVFSAPVPGPGRRWLMAAFQLDWNKEWSAAELAVLQTAAACLGAAIHRRAFEVERLSQERERADEALALGRLLEGVLQASRALLESTDFDIAIERWLVRLAEALDADRAMYEARPSVDKGKGVTRRSFSWAKPGVAAHVQCDLDFVAHVTHAGRLERGLAVWLRREDLIDPELIGRWDAAGFKNGLLVPVFLEGRSVAMLGFDWTSQRDWRPSYGTVMRTATDGAAAAIDLAPAFPDTAYSQCSAGF